MMKTRRVWPHWPHGTSQSLSSAHLLGNDKSEKARERKAEGKIQVFHPSLLWRLVIINTEQVSVHTCCLCAVCSHSQILPALPECQIDYYFSLCDRPRDFLHSAQYPSDAFWAARSDVYVKSAVIVTVSVGWKRIKFNASSCLTTVMFCVFFYLFLCFCPFRGFCTE